MLPTVRRSARHQAKTHRVAQRTERERIAAAKLKVAADKLRNRETEGWIVELARKDAG